MRTQRLKKTLYALLVASMVLHLPRADSRVLSDTLRFAFVSDLHFGKSDYNGEPLFPAMWLKKILAEIERKKAEFMFLGGDLIESSNSSSQYAMFDSAMQTALPWYPMAGNHDVGAEPQTATLEKLLAWIQLGYGRGSGNREYYGFVRRSIGAFFVLNAQAYISLDPVVRQRADSQLVEMDWFFTEHASVRNKFICSHVPLFQQRQVEDSTYFNIGKSYRARILALMNKHGIRYYLAGHRHENAVSVDGGITVFAHTALSFQLGSGSERGYYIYTLTSSTVRREFYPFSPEPDEIH